MECFVFECFLFLLMCLYVVLNWEYIYWHWQEIKDCITSKSFKKYKCSISTSLTLLRTSGSLVLVYSTLHGRKSHRYSGVVNTFTNRHELDATVPYWNSCTTDGSEELRTAGITDQVLNRNQLGIKFSWF